MKADMNNQKHRYLYGIELTKNRFYYFLILSIIDYTFSFFLMTISFEVLLNAIEISEISYSLYYKVVILGFFSLATSLVFLGIGAHALKRLRLFKKSLKN